jgi:stage II sporulation protein R
MSFFKKNGVKLLYIYSLILFLVAYGFYMADGYAREVKQDIRSSVIRFHVIANSNTPEDQLLKLNVRDAVLSYMEPYLEESTSIEHSREIVIEHMQQITQVAATIIANWDKPYSATTKLSMEEFPTKVYGDIALPKGTYESCRIIIGEGKGENWWCVMYPPLCYVDAATGILPDESKEALQGSLTKKEYEIIQFEADKPYEIRFKLLEWLGN